MENIQLILIHKIGPTSEMISAHLKALPEIDIISKYSVEEAIHTMLLLDHVDLVICQSELIGTETSEKLEKLKEDLHFKTLNIGINGGNLDDSGHIEDSADWELITKKCIHLLSEQEIGGDKFIGFDLGFFHFLDKAPCDIYVLVKKVKQDDQYIKRIHATDVMDKDALKRFSDLKVKCLYIQKENTPDFVSEITNQLQINLNKSQAGDKDSIEQTISESLNYTSSIINKVGMKNTSSSLINNILGKIQNTINNSEKQNMETLSDLLAKKDFRYFNQVFLTSMIGSNILSQMEWGTILHEEKIAQAAFFADIYLNFQDWSIIREQSDFERYDLDHKGRKNILEHAKLSRDDLMNFSNLLPDVENLVLHHHGSASGTGLESRWSKKLSKLSLVFNIAYHFSIEILKFEKTDDDIDFVKALEKLEDEFNHNECLEKTFFALRCALITKLQNV